jgi:hypothetical protein
MDKPENHLKHILESMGEGMKYIMTSAVKCEIPLSYGRIEKRFILI